MVDMFISNHGYILLFFFYGLAFFSMGISALQQRVPKGTNFFLLKSIRLLGYFGIIHGITEWVIMLRIINVFPVYQLLLIVIATFLNSLSFAFLWGFGVKLLGYKGKHKKIFNRLPWLVFTVWFVGFIISYSVFKTDRLHWLFVEDTTSRYFIGLPGAMITALALYKNAKYLSNINLKDIAIKLNGMSMLFFIYGVFAGVIVEKSNFLPASIINKDLFYQLFRFPVELARAISATGITVLFISAIDIFIWETNLKIAMLSKVQLISKERKKLGQELHDGIIQNLFATGLQVESLIDMETDKEKQENLFYIKNNLNDTIAQVREFIKKIATQNINIEELKEKLIELITNFEKNSGIPIEFNYYVSELIQGFLSNEKVTQLYYIIQEAVSNAIKHSSATKITITINADIKDVVATITDNGTGFNQEETSINGHYGLISMKERATSVNGKLIINSNEKGAKISISIPWEDDVNGTEKY